MARLVVILAAVVVSVGVLWTFGAYLEAGPGDVGVLLPLEFAATRNTTNFWQLDNAEGPRVVAYGSFVLQRYVSGLEIRPYFAVNLGLVAASLVAVFAFVWSASGRLGAAILALLFVSTHEQWVQTNEWLMGRQYTLALLFGIGAMWLRLRAPPTWPVAAAMLVLLAASALSVDYGLVFSGAILLDATLRRNPRFAAAALAAVAIFLAARFTLSSGIYRTDVLQCNDMAFLWKTRFICTRLISLDPNNVAQIAYNMGAGFIAMVWPSLPLLVESPVDGAHGYLQSVSLRDVVVAVCILLLAIEGWRRNRTIATLLVGVILSTAILCGPVFRLRALQYGYVAYAILVAIGAESLLRTIFGRYRGPVLVGAVATYLLFVLVPTLARWQPISAATAGPWWQPDRICKQAEIYAARRLRGSSAYPNAEAIQAVLKANGVDYCNIKQQ
jgi:hypothetical protein